MRYMGWVGKFEKYYGVLRRGASLFYIIIQVSKAGRGWLPSGAFRGCYPLGC